MQAGDLFDAVVRSLLSHDHVMDMALTQAGRRNPNKSRLGPQLGQPRRTAVAHPRTQSAVELMDRKLLDTTRGKTEFEPLRDFIKGDPGAVLIVEFMGDSIVDLPERIDRLEPVNPLWQIDD